MVCAGQWEHHCVQSDDMEKIFPEIEQADMIVFASPLYFFSWPTQIKSVIDRLYPYALEKSERSVAGKECALLLAAATDVQEEAKGMLESYRILAEYMHWHSVGEVVAYGVDKKGDGSKYGVSRTSSGVRFSLNF